MSIRARSSVHPIHVETTELGGYLEVTLDDGGAVVAEGEVHGQVVVSVEDLRSGNPLVDRETLRRLHPRRHPTIVGTLTSLTPGPVAGYEATGTLSFYGVTRPVAGDVTIHVSDKGLTVEGEQVFDVRDWGLQPPQLLLLKVHPDVHVRLEMRLQPERA